MLLVDCNSKQLLFLELQCCIHSRGVTEDGSCYSHCFALISQVHFSSKAFTSFTLFIVTHTRKRVLQRLRKGFRNLTLTGKRLESRSSTAGVSQESHFTSLLWESLGILLGLCALLSLPHFTALTAALPRKKLTFFIYEYLREKLLAPSIGEIGILVSSQVWICNENVPRQPACLLTYSSLESVLGRLCLVSKCTLKKCSEPFKRGQADKDSNVKMVPWLWQVLSHQ